MKLLQLLISLLLALNVQALTVSDRGTATSNASTGSISISPSGNMAAGSTGILCYAGDNASGPSTNLPTSFTDSVGNTWYQRDTSGVGSAPNNNVEVAVYTGYLTTGITTSDSITITFVANTTAKNVTLYESVPAAGNRALFVKTNHAGGTGTSTTNTVGGVVPIGSVTIGMVGVENGSETFPTPDTDTSNGTWSTQQTTSAGSSTTGTAIASQSKVQATASSGQTYNQAGMTSADWNGIDVQLCETDLKTKSMSANSTTEAATAMPVTLPIASGSLAVVALSADNAGTSGTTANLPTTLTDTGSNTWTLQETGIRNQSGVNTGSEFGLYTSILTTGLSVGNTITATYQVASVPTKSWAIWEFVPASNFTWQFVTGAAGAGANTASPTITTSSITNGDTVVAMMAAEGTEQATGDADTSNGTWSSQASMGFGTSTSGMAVSTQFKTVTGTATQTYNPTLVAAQDNILGWIEVAPLSTGPSTTQKASFFNLFQ